MNFYDKSIVFLFLAFSSSSVQSEILEATSTVIILQAPPITAVPNTSHSVQSDKIQVFSERQGIVTPNGIPRVVPGTRVNSYFVHYDPVLLPHRGFALDRVFSPPAKITFSNPIIAIYSADTELDSTDAIFGSAGAYPGGLFYRGAEGRSNNDSFSFSGNTLTIHRLFVRDSATEPGADQLRVITATKFQDSAP